MIPKTYFNSDDPGVLRLLSEAEWRGIGITQSLGWEHYEVHGTLAICPFCTYLSDGHCPACPHL
jgi:Cyclin-dependent kinase regulatory subunit